MREVAISLNVLASAALFLSASGLPACAAAPDSWLTDGGWGGGGSGSSGSGGGPGSFGGDGGAGAEPCSDPGSTRSCCEGAGTQTCISDGEFSHWGPCLDSSGNPPVCGGTGGGGNEDSGAPPPPPQDDAGGPGNGGGGNEPPPIPGGCNYQSSEPELICATSPSAGQSVSSTGQIKLWLTDEGAPAIAPGEKVDPNTGAITPGNRSAVDPFTQLPLEPVLYIGGKGFYPDLIKGSYTSTYGAGNAPNSAFAAKGPPIDSIPNGASCNDVFTGEDIWNVSSLGLPPGNYTAQFSAHDGDGDRGVICVDIVIH